MFEMKQVKKYEELSQEELSGYSQGLMKSFPTKTMTIDGKTIYYTESSLVIDRFNEVLGVGSWEARITDKIFTIDSVTIVVDLYFFGKFMASGLSTEKFAGNSKDASKPLIAYKDAIRTAAGVLGMSVTKHSMWRNIAQQNYQEPQQHSQQQQQPVQQQQYYSQEQYQQPAQQQYGGYQQSQQQGYNNQYQNNQQPQGGQQGSPFAKVKDNVASCQSCGTSVSGITADYSYRKYNGQVFCKPHQPK